MTAAAHRSEHDLLGSRDVLSAQRLEALLWPEVVAGSGSPEV
jgi:hypothetical protein